MKTDKDFVKVSELLPDAWDRITKRVKNKQLKEKLEKGGKNERYPNKGYGK